MRLNGVAVRVIENRFPAIAVRLPAQARRVVRQTTLEIERDIKTSMSGPKHGHAYALHANFRKATRNDVKAGFASARGEKVETGWAFHRASAPGEAPARWYGILANSIQTAFYNSGSMGMVFTNIDYGLYLEFGTRRMAARPFMGPAAQRGGSRFEVAMANLENLLR